MQCVVFKVTNRVDSKVYIGTEVLEDSEVSDHLGRNAALKKDIKRLGKDKFTKEVLGSYSTYAEMYELERALVHEAFVSSPRTYNVDLGGIGDAYYVKGKRNNLYRPKVPEITKATLTENLKEYY